MHLDYQLSCLNTFSSTNADSLGETVSNLFCRYFIVFEISIKFNMKINIPVNFFDNSGYLESVPSIIQSCYASSSLYTLKNFAIV